jgi:hypothetical protein
LILRKGLGNSVDILTMDPRSHDLDAKDPVIATLEFGKEEGKMIWACFSGRIAAYGSVFLLISSG